MSDAEQGGHDAKTPTFDDGGKGPKRRRTMLGAIVVFAVVAAAYVGYNYWRSLNYAYTDDAYVHANVVQVTPQVGGTVVSIGADDTQRVKAGQPLLILDGADTRVALEQAEAALGEAVRRVRVAFADNTSLEAAISMRQSEVVKAQASLAKAQDALRRRQALAGSGAVGAEDLHQAEIGVREAQAALLGARAAVKVARGQLVSSEARTAGAILADNPTVRLAAARVRQAYLAHQRTVILAPVDGVIGRRTVQLGQRVAPGVPLMSVIPLQGVWVDANVKETQLGDIRIGQPATVVADTYGGSVRYRGRVVGLAAGSGSAFALIPAQDATGNWIKVVQRIPVRIALESSQLKRHPLRVGMSTEVTIDIRDHRGAPILGRLARHPAAQTSIYATDWEKADSLIRAIVVANAGSQG